MRVMRLVVLFALMVGMMPMARAMQCGDQNLTSQIIQQKAQKIQVGGKISLLKEDGTVVNGNLSAIGDDSVTVLARAQDGDKPVTVKFSDTCIVARLPLGKSAMPVSSDIRTKIARHKAGGNLRLQVADYEYLHGKIVSIGPDSILMERTDKYGKTSTSMIPYADIRAVNPGQTGGTIVAVFTLAAVLVAVISL